MIPTAKAILEHQQRVRLQATLHHLFYRLKKHIRVYLQNQNDEMPEHDVAWETTVQDGGPDTVLLDALKMHPELWAHAIPEECCIVVRAHLQLYAQSKMIADHLELEGAYRVANQAAQLLHEFEEKEAREKYLKGT